MLFVATGSLYHDAVVGVLVVNTAGVILIHRQATILTSLVTDSLIPGIVVHSNAPGDTVSNTVVATNTLRGDGWGKTDGPRVEVGILIVATAFSSPTPPATLTNTAAAANRISNEDYGIYISTATGAHVGGLPLDHATMPVVP